MTRAFVLAQRLGNITEKWGGDTELNPKKTGMWSGWSQEDLRAERSKLKSEGPHEAGSAKATRLKEVNFALRAKTGWGKV